MHRGYIKLWRKTDESGLLQMPETFALFAFLLIKATHKPRKIGTPYGMIELDRGQYISGRLELASALKLTERKVRTSIDRLVNMGIIVTKPTSRFTIYTIVNYNDYQSDDIQPTSETPTGDQQATNERPASDQQATTKQTHKHYKNVKNEKKRTLLPAAEASGADQLQEACRQTWLAYKTAYFDRYGTEPVRNAKVSSMVKNFVQRIGMEESPQVAVFYVQHNERFYVQKLHPVELLLKDAEGIRTQWATGKSMTGTRANQIDKSQANLSAVDEARLILEAKNAKTA